MISIVMSMWNRKDMTVETIESVLAQTYKDFEFIIVDDGSTDGSIEMVEEYMKKDKRIKLIKLKHAGSGGTDAWNAGFKVAKGDAICVLGSDDLWLPNKLERQVVISISYPDYILHSDSISIDEYGKELEKTYFTDRTPSEYKKRALVEATPWFVTSSWYIPKHIFDKVGLFEGVYNDYQWMMRAIILHDVKMKLIPEWLTKHRTNPNSNTFKYVGLKKFMEIAKEIREDMKRRMDQDELLRIVKLCKLICGFCKRAVPYKCPKCGSDLRKRENLLCIPRVVVPYHCANCWRLEHDIK